MHEITKKERNFKNFALFYLCLSNNLIDSAVVDNLALTACADICELESCNLTVVDEKGHIALIGAVFLGDIVDYETFHHGLAHVNGLNGGVGLDSVQSVYAEIFDQNIALYPDYGENVDVELHINGKPLCL